MQSVNAAFTAEEKDSFRKIAQNTQISWHKESTLGNQTFTIGVSTVGGSDVIGINPGAVGSPANYKYFNETPYVTSLGWERGYNMPTGGLTKALAEIHLDNTSGRFTPRYMGGNSELATAQPLRSPVIINAGFNLGGVDITLPQFAGIVTEQPELSVRDKTYDIKASDYIDYFQNKFLDQAVIFTAETTDQVLTNLSTQLGMNTAEYEYDSGLNVINFGLFDVGTRFSDAIGQLVEAENGNYYQREDGKFIFENRYHWQNSPYTQVQKLITTAQVIDSQSPNLDHLINVVEVRGQPRAKQVNQLVWQSTSFAGSGAFSIPPSSTKELFVNFDDPVLSIDTPVANGTVGQTSFYAANLAEDGSGIDATSSMSVDSIYKFAQSTKIVFRNNSSTNTIYLVNLDIWGRPARRTGDIYVRTELGNSITAYQERVLTIDNDFIQNNFWAESYGQMIINDFGVPENIQRLSIRAIPELQLGDLISYQGKYWRIYDIKTQLAPDQGFIQDLLLLQRSQTVYFRIGISTIGGSDTIGP